MQNKNWGKDAWRMLQTRDLAKGKNWGQAKGFSRHNQVIDAYNVGIGTEYIMSYCIFKQFMSTSYKEKHWSCFHRMSIPEEKEH